MKRPSPQTSFDLDVEASPQDATYVLHQLEVFNWGPFSGMHRAEIDPHGTAVIGPTGSGKTTLIDGLMTLLVAQPKYNLASTGGHESDRTLSDYVRGVLGGDGTSEREGVARPGKTITGLCATYLGGRNETLKLAAVLWTDGPSNAAQDLKRRWIFSQADNESLASWLRLLHEESVRHLMKHGRETEKLRIFDSKKSYLAHIRKFFDVGENAFTLLNRAAGLKQLNSIDEIFRDLVLDDHSAFDRALEVASEFDNLADIHSELEIARKQQAALAPIATENTKLKKAKTASGIWRTLKRILPIWYAREGEKRWTAIADAIVKSYEEERAHLEAEEREASTCESRVETLRERYLKLGGNVIGELEKTIEEQIARVAERRKHAEEYATAIETLGLNPTLSEHQLDQNKALLTQRRASVAERREKQNDETLKAYSRQRDHETRLIEVENELRKVKERPGSNIPPKFQDFRTTLAHELGLAEDELPFVAEMIEVKPEDNAWRGAIERAIGSERLRLLVPEQHIDTALRWVNQRDNKVHVRLQRARPGSGSREFKKDGFTRKLNFKPHALRDSVKELLAASDRHCVASPDALRDTEHAMTIEGMMSGRQGKFEKQDQRPLNHGWMTGFDNQDQLRSLAQDLATIQEHTEQWQTTARKQKQGLTALDQQLNIIDELTKLEFATIDLPSAEAHLAASTARRDALLDPKSDASQAKQLFDQAHQELKDLRNRISQRLQALAVLDEKKKNAVAEQEASAYRASAGMNEEEQTLAEKHLTIPSDLEAHALDEAERQSAKSVEEKLMQKQTRVQEHQQRLIRFMEVAKRVDTGALAEAGTELIDIPEYLEQLRVLNDEALPEKQKRFLSYLNKSSGQGVIQLLSGITEEVDRIEQRIEDLNHTLAKVDFRSGRFLQLQPQRIRHERLRSLESAQRHLTSSTLEDDQGESQYKALQDIVEILREAGDNRRQQGSRALLDPRYRLQFSVIEEDRATGERSQPRTGSQSGSGGEKELMASHILTASLSYALCPSEGSRPLYGTIVLDEAFSKSSPSAATRIIEALRIFGLHPIFVTPNKEIGLLKKHTRKVICVQRPGKHASLASISWEQLEDMAKPS